MADNKAIETAEDKRESIATTLPVYDARSVASEELYFVTPQATGQDEEQAVKPDNEPKLSDELKTERERIDGPMSPQTIVDTDVEMRSRTEEAAKYSQEAPQEAPPLPPKGPIDDESVTVEKNVIFMDEKPPVLPTRPSLSEDEKRAMQLQAEEDGVHAGPASRGKGVSFEDTEKPPGLPTRPASDDEELATNPQAEEDDTTPNLSVRHVSFDPALGTSQSTYTFLWRRPLTDYPTLTITPNADSRSYWRLNYESKYFARLYRYQADQARVDGDIPARQVAEIKFPEFIWPGCGPAIKIEPHGEAAGPERKETFMKCAGWMTTRYSLDMSVLGGAKCTWRAIRPPKKDANGGGNGQDADMPSQPDPTGSDSASPTRGPLAQKSAGELVTVGDVIAQAKAYINDESWTPYPKLHLVLGTATSSGRVIASYSRAAPWNKNAGELSIVSSQHEPNSDEYTEGIIIACTAMVGMQDRMGLANSLMEASTESVVASKRKGNLPTANKIRPYIRLQKSNTAPTSEKTAAAPVVPDSRRETVFQRSLKRLSAQLVARPAGAVPERKGAVDEKKEVGVAA
ncbi:Hypothetical predicted protein [Lecanosticta acicola]|uniref:Uncharacterized protein n=1 Tax=Lecanosticta acicola TaxID=111012 RepID=A0AAI8Z2S9_9PEZI|nr:Hypothetical predicted protein [Lecanosticta acicola]